jgi:hypothetical protein
VRQRSRYDNRGGGLWYGDPGYWYDDSAGYAEPNELGAPEMMPPWREARSAAPTAPVASPLVIDVPAPRANSTEKATPAAVFVLTNGERIEARRYLFTHDRLSLTVDQKERTIPRAMLDLKATAAADRERGIDLRIPVSANEISLSF